MANRNAVAEQSHEEPADAPPGTTSEDFSHASEYCERVNTFFEEKIASGQAEETALPALKLHLFNYVLKHQGATQEELENEFSKINRLSDMEREYGAESNPLPTIGIEIELPRTHLSAERVQILEQLGIANEDAIDKNFLLWEVNPSFSYSPWVPARVLQELAEMGSVPLEKNVGSDHPRIPKDDAFSLHVNFGIPDGLEWATRLEHQTPFFLLNDCLTYAFATPQRLLNRKFLRSIYIGKDAKKTKKNKGKFDAGDGTKDEEDDVLEQLPPQRVELRAMEFRDYPTFRMLAESQKLMTMLFGALTCRAATERSPGAEALALLWTAFAEEVGEHFAQLQLPNKIMDSEKERVVDILEKTHLKQWCREIVQRYATEVTKVIARNTDHQQHAPG